MAPVTNNVLKRDGRPGRMVHGSGKRLQLLQKKENQRKKDMQLNHIRKYYYGDIPEDKSGGGTDNLQKTNNDWPLWEVFIRSKQGLDHKHMGSLHAADAQMAIENARDVYTRRMEGVSIWVVESKYIHASNPEEADELYEPAIDKIYRHPTFYDLPDEVKHM